MPLRSIRLALPSPPSFCIFGGLLSACENPRRRPGSDTPRPQAWRKLRPDPHGKRPCARDRHRSWCFRCRRLCGRLGRLSWKRGSTPRGSGLFLGCFFLSRLPSRLFFGRVSCWRFGIRRFFSRLLFARRFSSRLFSARRLPSRLLFGARRFFSRLALLRRFSSRRSPCRLPACGLRRSRRQLLFTGCGLFGRFLLAAPAPCFSGLTFLAGGLSDRSFLRHACLQCRFPGG
jgi:hypothetical protein